MKILVVATWYPTPEAPVMGVFVRKDAQALARDHEVTLLHLAPPAAFASAPADEIDGAVDVRRVPFDVKRPDHWARASRLIRRISPRFDLVHSMAFSTLLPMALGRPENPWVHTEHWSAIPSPSSLGSLGPVIVPPITRLEAKPDVVVPVCEFLARPIRRRRSGPTHVVPCIVEVADPVAPRPEPGEWLRLVSVGALVERKDPVTAVETVAELGARGLPAELTWVGDGPLRGRVLERAAQLGISQRIHLAGSTPPHEVARHTREADVFLLPTLAENFCVSAAEAIAQGRPVVVGSNGGQAEYIDASVGAVVDAQTSVHYAEAVMDVWRKLAGVPAEAIAARVGRRFSERAVREGYRAAYDLALVARGGAGR